MISERPLNAEQIAMFHRDGYVVVPGFFDVEAFQPALDAMDSDPDFGGNDDRPQGAFDGILGKTTPFVDTGTKTDRAATIIHRDRIAACS